VCDGARGVSLTLLHSIAVIPATLPAQGVHAVAMETHLEAVPPDIPRGPLLLQ